MRKAVMLPAAIGVAGIIAGVLTPVVGLSAASASSGTGAPTFNHLVVIYEENHSFDNLYGGWGPVGGKLVDGYGGPGYLTNSTQKDQSGNPITCLYQNDANLATVNQSFAWIDKTTGHPGHQTAACQLTLPNGAKAADSHFTTSAPFKINDYVKTTDTSCSPSAYSAPSTGVLAKSIDATNGDPQGAAGGCTRDIVHRFYQEQYQIDGGKQDRYPTGSDAAGLTQGYYDTTALPVYQYLHGAYAPNYVVADHFFQSAFGGSFLNHQYLIAAKAPVWPNATVAQHAVLDTSGFPNGGYPLYAPQTGIQYNDSAITQACPVSTSKDAAGNTISPTNNLACGDFAVNTVQPANYPSAALNPDGSVKNPSSPPLPLINDTDPTAANYETNIGDELTAKGVSWDWYAGGWDDANAGTPDPLFQFHHQPFNYFANYAKGKPGRDHLKDEKDFIASAQAGTLPSVSFVKPIGEENEHPGYASTDNGESHLVDLLKDIENGPQASDTLVVVTYDEFGGQWDHVAPPGQGNNDGPHDAYGPGTRIPALILGPMVHHSTVDSTSYDTTSILKTIEDRWGVASLGYRDAHVNDLNDALTAAASPVSTATTAHSSKSRLRPGAHATISGAVKNGSTILTGLTVVLYERADSSHKWTRVTSAKTAGNGFSFGIRGLRHSEQYQVVSPAQSANSLSYSRSASRVLTVGRA